jgi:hypothetical protein
MANGIEPTEPWHPEAYSYRREIAYGATREEAIANVKAKALKSGLPVELQAQPVVVNA